MGINLRESFQLVLFFLNTQARAIAQILVNDGEWTYQNLGV